MPPSGGDSILEPLCFPDVDDSSVPSSELVCLLCSQSVALPQKDVLLKHLLLEHQLVVAEVQLVADLPKYGSEPKPEPELVVVPGFTDKHLVCWFLAGTCCTGEAASWSSRSQTSAASSEPTPRARLVSSGTVVGLQTETAKL